MTIFEVLIWMVLGAVLGVLVAAFWRTKGLTFARAVGFGVFGGLVGGLIGRILFIPGPHSGTMEVSSLGLLVAGIGAVLTVLGVRFELRNRERPRLS